jgi:hypothetical protein
MYSAKIPALIVCGMPRCRGLHFRKYSQAEISVSTGSMLSTDLCVFKKTKVLDSRTWAGIDDDYTIEGVERS